MATHKRISEILAEVSKVSSRKGKIEKLQEYDKYDALKSILIGAFDSRVEWLLPEGVPPYTPANEVLDDPGLHREFRKFYIFTKGRDSNKVSQIKRETLFIQLLESLHPEDAELMCAVKDKKMPYKGITGKLVNEAFPGLIQ